jgi:hypothetical protein
MLLISLGHISDRPEAQGGLEHLKSPFEEPYDIPGSIVQRIAGMVQGKLDYRTNQTL